LTHLILRPLTCGAPPFKHSYAWEAQCIFSNTTEKNSTGAIRFFWYMINRSEGSVHTMKSLQQDHKCVERIGDKKPKWANWRRLCQGGHLPLQKGSSGTLVSLLWLQISHCAGWDRCQGDIPPPFVSFALLNLGVHCSSLIVHTSLVDGFLQIQLCSGNSNNLITPQAVSSRGEDREGFGDCSV